MPEDADSNEEHQGTIIAESDSPTSVIDPSKLRLTQNFHEGLGVKKLQTGIQTRKPGRQEFIRVHDNPDYSLQTAVLEFKDEGEVYLVSPELWEELSGELVPKILYLTINRQGVLRIWPIRLPDDEGKLDSWNQSALQAAEIAKTRWVRVASNRAAGIYEVYEANHEVDEPEWPEESFDELLAVAFRGFYITDRDHPALRKLRGDI